jgi:predicted nucleic acid-binding protein
MAGPIYLADTSVYVLQGRHPQVRKRFETLLAEGRLAACQMTSLEFLNNAPDPKSYEKLLGAFYAQRWLDVNTDAMSRALATHRSLARTSQHRNFRLPDLIIAATAELNGATLLHYDADYDRIAAITGQPTEWVAPRGSL